MHNLKHKIIQARKSKAREYAQVNSNPLTKGIVQALITVVDLFIMFVLIWNMFAIFIPSGSWINIVDGSSMFPTMNSGQIIFSDTSKNAIERGDIITAYMPEYAWREHPEKKGKIIVKRVIGVPGDRLVINEKGIFINGSLLKEDYLTDDARANTFQNNACNSVLLSDDEYFVLGDNRAASYDSRGFGVVRRSDILYEQSTKPTSSFYWRLMLVIIMLALNLAIYMLVEFVLTECAYGILYHKQIRGLKSDANIETTETNTKETIDLKGDEN